MATYLYAPGHLSVTFWIFSIASERCDKTIHCSEVKDVEWSDIPEKKLTHWNRPSFSLWSLGFCHCLVFVLPENVEHEHDGKNIDFFMKWLQCWWRWLSHHHNHPNSHLSGNRGSLSLKEPRVLDCFHRAGCCISSDLTVVSILLFLDLSRFFPPLSSFISTIVFHLILPTSFRTVSLSLAPFFALTVFAICLSPAFSISAFLFGWQWQCLPLNEWGQLDVKLSILYAKTHLKIF